MAYERERQRQRAHICINNYIYSKNSVTTISGKGLINKGRPIYFLGKIPFMVLHFRVIVFAVNLQLISVNEPIVETKLTAS